MSTIHCANCAHGNAPKARFCAHCGQELHVHRLDAHYFWHELQHGVLHADKGIFFTIKELAVRPGRMVREFLAGRRAAHFKPMAFLLLLAGTYTLLRHYAPVDTDYAPVHDPATYNMGKKLGQWVGDHLAWAWLVMGPLMAWAIQRLFHRFANFNIYEVFTLVLYLTGEMFGLLLVVLPIRLLLPPTPYGQTPWYYYPCLAYLLWGIWQFYELALPRPWPRLWRATLGITLAAGLSSLVLVAFVAVAILTGFIHVQTTNP